MKSIRIGGTVDVHPNWSGDFADGNDIAVITLENVAPFGASDYQAFTGSNEVGQNMIVTGFGRTGTVAGGGAMANPSPGEEYQRLSVSASAGNYTLGLNGGTANLAFNATAAQIETAVESLPLVTNATVRQVTRGPHNGSFEIRFNNPAQNIDQISVNTASLTGTAVVNTVQNGAGDRVRRFDTNTWDSLDLGGTGLEIDLDNAVGEGLPGGGDSGGPGFIDTGSGDLAVAVLFRLDRTVLRLEIRKLIPGFPSFRTISIRSSIPQFRGRMI